jgi:hypothetical protein
MPSSINIDLEQMKNLLLQFSADEKIELAKYLDKLTLRNRFSQFVNTLQNIPLTFDDLEEEVNAVREEQYQYRTHKPQ